MAAKLLVVDDEQDFTELLTHNLSSNLYEVLTARDGIDALNKARRHLPDLIILDVMLPDIDGLAICDILRRQPSTADIPIIVITALYAESVSGMALRFGASSVLTKPVDMNRVRESVFSALALRDRRALTPVAEEENTHTSSVILPAFDK
jgi:Response regulator containing CheY-like receiver, AAA-type ATPase, and DNA-binding domains